MTVLFSVAWFTRADPPRYPTGYRRGRRWFAEQPWAETLYCELVADAAERIVAPDPLDDDPPRGLQHVELARVELARMNKVALVLAALNDASAWAVGEPPPAVGWIRRCDRIRRWRDYTGEGVEEGAPRADHHSPQPGQPAGDPLPLFHQHVASEAP